jgi:hypothetical protein
VVGVERKQDAPGTLQASRHASKNKKTQNISNTGRRNQTSPSRAYPKIPLRGPTSRKKGFIFVAEIRLFWQADNFK